jgi:hypothetical protein
MSVGHLLVPASHPEDPHVTFPSRNEGQTAVNLKLTHSLSDEPLNLREALMENGRGFPDLIYFVGRLDHPQLANKKGNIRKTTVGKGFCEPEIKLRRENVHFKPKSLVAMDPQIPERVADGTPAVDGDNVPEGAFLFHPLHALLHHKDGVALCWDEQDGRLDGPGEIKNVHVLEKEGAVQILGRKALLEFCKSLINLLRLDFFHVSVLTRSLNKLRFSENREPSAHKRIDDLGKGGLLPVEHHRRPVVRSLDIPQQLIIKNPLLRFQDIPYPVPGIISPGGRRNMKFQEHGLVAGFSGGRRPRRERQHSSKQKDCHEIAMFHPLSSQEKDTLESDPTGSF